MPIIDVEIVLKDNESIDSALTQKLADSSGEVFETPNGRTWVRLRELPRGHYAENGGAGNSVRPVFVNVLKAVMPEGQTLDAEALALTRAVAQVCDRSAEHVHVLYRPEGTGRMFFGGRVVGP
jgi:phenylpyruvate tautomerase PptA (4-oxalocrotonate tautomerase family)